jgi:hypothetical protein
MAITPPYGYNDIVPLTRDQRVILPKDGKLPAVFRDMTAIPLSFSEFTVASREYPIAFVAGAGGRFLAMAILGLEGQQNLFAPEGNAWAAGTYIPAYVRRYPFCMMKVTNDDGSEQPERIACVEKRALSERGTALIDAKGDDLPDWAARKQLLMDYEVDLARTEEMCKALADAGVLEPFNMQATPTGGEPLSMTGMQRVNEDRLNAVAPEKIREWMVQGVLSRVYMHILSLGNFGRLLERRAEGKRIAA